MNKNHYTKVSKCPVSDSEDKFSYLDLGLIPLVNNLNNTKQESLNCDKYPLVVDYYSESKLSMLSVVVDPNILFAHYVYKSGTSQPYIEHCKEMYGYISRFTTVDIGDRFVDIGGNDGTLLSTFNNVAGRGKNLDLINVDPSENLGKISRAKRIVTVTKMWDTTLGSQLNGTCKVITSTNVFQHIKDISGFVDGIHKALKSDGIWCLEFPYWGHDLDTNQYDQVYHEHVYYYLLTPLFKLFNDRGIRIIDVSEQSIHGGTLRVISQKHDGTDREIPHSVSKILEFEKKFDDEFYRQWSVKVKEHLKWSKEFLLTLKNQGKKIVGFGAAAKGCTFLNASEINHEIIDYIVDDTDTKQNKFMPGVGIPIVDRNHLINNPPDYVVILAHNFADYIKCSLKSIYSGKFIVMFPEPTIYD